MTVLLNDPKSAMGLREHATLGGAMKGVDECMPPSARASSAPHEALRRRAADIGPDEALVQLRAAQAEHPFWQNRLFKACSAGHLSKDDFKLLFGQYYLYSKNFTRFLSALMANLDNDYHRARLAENLWEEAGERAPEARHAEIFRRFLGRTLGIDIETIEYLDTTRFFVREYLDFCLRSDPIASSAFLSLGTEAIVPRMYGILRSGLLRAGVSDDETEFFRIHMECDDEHAATLAEIMVSHAGQPEWFSTCRRAIGYALSLRLRFFEQLYDAIEMRKVRDLVSRVRARVSLAPDSPRSAELRYRVEGRADAADAVAGVALYANKNTRLDVDFAVERVPLGADVFDTRILRIAPRKSNELHKHAHESLFYVIRGRGRVRVNDGSFEVAPADVVFVPRWAMHQTQNTADEELVILAITDAAFTDACALGDGLRQARWNEPSAPRIV